MRYLVRKVEPSRKFHDQENVSRHANVCACLGVSTRTSVDAGAFKFERCTVARAREPLHACRLFGKRTTALPMPRVLTESKRLRWRLAVQMLISEPGGVRVCGGASNQPCTSQENAAAPA
eukprot:6193672-Pleurochrysis_carterae.AAC.3